MGVLNLDAVGHHQPVCVPTFICEPCREQDHEHCPGRGQCDCQHRPVTPVEPATGAPGE